MKSPPGVPISIPKKLLGEHAGLSFGNISQRIQPFRAPPHARHFIITGSQTGKLDTLTGAHYALVSVSYPDRNLLVAEGPILPSSESLTHATLYAIDNDLRWVMHIHSSTLWRVAPALDLPITHPDAPCGTPAMAEEMRRLFLDTDVGQRGIFSMVAIPMDSSSLDQQQQKPETY